jgi:hypothetical protein
VSENKTYNNYLLYTQTILNWLAHPKKGNIMPENVLQGATQRSVVDNKPAAYTDEEMGFILGLVRKTGDEYMEDIILTCYYAAVRSKAEMSELKIGNVLFDRDLLLLKGDATKARRAIHSHVKSKGSADRDRPQLMFRLHFYAQIASQELIKAKLLVCRRLEWRHRR